MKTINYANYFKTEGRLEKGETLIIRQKHKGKKIVAVVIRASLQPEGTLMLMMNVNGQTSEFLTKPS